MNKRMGILYLLAVCSIFALMTACGNGGGGGGGGGGNDSGNFYGSCTEVDIVDWIVCVDYYEGYTVQDAKDLCALTNDSYSSEKCASVNTGLTKIPGKCEVIDPPAYNNRRSQISYYEPNWTLSATQAHCDAFNSISGYSGTWITD